MWFKVLKPFPISFDGAHVENLDTDQVIKVDGSISPGLVKAGYLEETDTPKPAEIAAVAAPAEAGQGAAPKAAARPSAKAAKKS